MKDIEGGAQQKSSRCQSRHRRRAAAERGRSVEIAESPNRSDHTRARQHEVHIGKRPPSSTSERQLDPGRRSKRDSQLEYRDSPFQTTTNAVEVSVNVSSSTFLGVYGQRDTDQGREYCCLDGAWFRPEDGIPDSEIREYNRKVVQSTRLQSLRKRKHKSSHDNTDTQVLQQVRRWKADL